MSSPFKTKKFLDLKDKWYKKLESDGFNDIERDEDTLKQWDSFNFSGSSRARYNRNLFASKEEYYRLAGQFLHEHKFNNERERLIWECHASGKSVTDTAQFLKRRRFKMYSRTGVHLIMQALTKEMLKKYGTDTDD